jgi:hypothetical protein
MTAFSTKLPLLPEILPKFTRQQLCRGLFWSDPKVRPPILDEMYPDIERVIASVAQHYCDSTTPHLHFDELVGEGRLKLAELITRGELDRLVSRYDFFRFFKTSVNNQARSRVQKYRFTEKRTGVKPPPREERFKPVVQGADDHEEHPPEHHKNVELSLDDEELKLQVPQVEQESERDAVDMMEEYDALLTQQERMVMHEMVKAGAETRAYAQYDAMRRRTGEKLHVKIKEEHMAMGLGMYFVDEETGELTADLKQFEKVVLSIRQKITAYRIMSDDQHDTQARKSARINTLKEVFGLQLPASLDDMVLRRMFTMAARDQYEEKVKDKPQVVEMLIEIGAKPPRLINGKMACFGVLYQKNCRKCNMCDLRDSCALDAANMGLTKIAISPRLLGAKQPRTPAFLPSVGDEPRITSTDEAEIVEHLGEVFEKIDKDDATYYYMLVGGKKRRYVFCIDEVSPLRLRFLNPGEELKKRLVGKNKTWCPVPDSSLSDVVSMIEQHSKEVFESEGEMI